MPIRKRTGTATHPSGRRCPSMSGSCGRRGNANASASAASGTWAAAPTGTAGPRSAPTPTVILTTAHLDHIPEHCDPDNLRAMCQACHLAYDYDHHAQTRLHSREVELLAAGQQYLPLDVDR